MQIEPGDKLCPTSSQNPRLFIARSGSVYGGVAVRVTPQRVIVNNASVTNANIAASNGVIHAVNRVLLPQQLRQKIASKLAMQ